MEIPASQSVSQQAAADWQEMVSLSEPVGLYHFHSLGGGSKSSP